MSGKRISIRARRAVSGYLFILPFIIGFLCFMLLPLVDSFWMSLCRVDVTAGQGFQTTFIGLDNYSAPSPLTRSSTSCSAKKSA